ncbi:NmrA family NAD(P)-binding protein [Microlunatus capsulatus]|uniref:Uncharacterized protein YbjT (DUF2867 family) n=1 Tax=Microlunatus capsulatus TaxID=99117 RepID=A0ABS4Z2Y1_9ACTN|nr:NmrA family NAD(P)-binding protein [Microlunatus capsulatus]MBP2415406.1 uncharacterized protein YbjT (DUF2867 family) [Microlunatus capsulatus]
MTAGGHPVPDGELGVLGATGQQGGAVVRALRARGAGVRALVRDVHDPRSRALAADGVHVVRADTDDPAGLPAAMAGLRGLFAMTVFAGHGPEGEVVQGRAVVDAAAAAGVPHVVYSSVGGADRGSGVPHFASKWAVEEHLRASGVPASVVRPVFFMENFLGALAPAPGDGDLVLRTPLRPGVPLQMIAVADIGAVAAAALLDPALVPPDGLEIGGDELTPEAVTEVVAARTGTTCRLATVPLADVGDDDSRAMFGWLGTLPAYRADVARTRRLQPALQTFDDFVAARTGAAARR